MIEELASYQGFREELRGWLAHHLPTDWRTRMLGASEAEHVDFQREWFRTLHEGGYVAPHWPVAWGGAGMSLAQQIVLYEELARAGAPRLVVYFISLFHAPSTLLEWGTDAQRKRHLPAILAGDEIWCQGFSEPGAGSDLASLRARAERRGDRYVVNGQKTWSSNAHLARYCLLLARTDPAARKHQGISYFILDMRSPGVTCRPIKMLTGGAHFNEIFLDDVEIPIDVFTRSNPVNDCRQTHGHVRRDRFLLFLCCTSCHVVHPLTARAVGQVCAPDVVVRFDAPCPDLIFG